MAFHKARSGCGGMFHAAVFSVWWPGSDRLEDASRVFIPKMEFPGFLRHEPQLRESLRMPRKRKLKGFVHETLSFHAETAQATWC